MAFNNSQRAQNFMDTQLEMCDCVDDDTCHNCTNKLIFTLLMYEIAGLEGKLWTAQTELDRITREYSRGL
jgi:hypothetical protein